VSVVFGADGPAKNHKVVLVTIPEQSEVRQDLFLDDDAISGRVVDPERRGVKGALVTALREGVGRVMGPDSRRRRRKRTARSICKRSTPDLTASPRALPATHRPRLFPSWSATTFRCASWI
jgi:hypothetical protein